MSSLRVPALVQGVFFTAQGLWPVLHLKSFEAVTGPKVDKWLVKTIGGLIAATGMALLAGRREEGPATPTLAIASSVALATADLVYVARKRISPVYLADAVVEVVFIALWLAELVAERGSAASWFKGRGPAEQ